MSAAKTVLVTGATGFVGQHVVRRLLAQGHTVVATGTDPNKASRFDWFSQVTFVPYVFPQSGDSQNLFNLFRQPDLLIHLAWQGLPDYRSLAHIERYWLQHYQFLTNLITNGLTDLTVTGTCLEYGLQEGCLFEELPSRPITTYGFAKDTLRQALTFFLTGQDVSFKWLRLFYMYGEGQNPKSLLAQLEAAALRGDTTFNMSKGEQLRDYLPIGSVADNIIHTALQQNVSGVINCCSGQPISVRSLVEQFMQERHYQLTLNLGYYPYPDYEPLAFWGNNQKLQTLINS
jgi:nucleoside-diphosphate-sugar epimerase